MFASVRKFILCNLLYQSLALSCHLLILHNCNPVFHRNLQMPVHRTNTGDRNLQVQFISAQTAVTRQKHAIMWSAGVNWKPHPQQECHLLLSLRECCSLQKELVWGRAGDICHQTTPSCSCICSLSGQRGQRTSPRASICKVRATQH